MYVSAHAGVQPTTSAMAAKSVLGAGEFAAAMREYKASQVVVRQDENDDEVEY